MASALLVGTQALSPAPCHSPADSSPRDRAMPGRRGWSLAQLCSVSLALPAGPSGVQSQALDRGTSLAITTISDSSIECSLLPPSVLATPALGLRGPAATPFTKAYPQSWALQSALLIDRAPWWHQRCSTPRPTACGAAARTRRPLASYLEALPLAGIGSGCSPPPPRAHPTSVVLPESSPWSDISIAVMPLGIHAHGG